MQPTKPITTDHSSSSYNRNDCGQP